MRYRVYLIFLENKYFILDRNVGTTNHLIILNYYKQIAHIMNIIGDWQFVSVPRTPGVVGILMNWRAGHCSHSQLLTHRNRSLQCHN